MTRLHYTSRADQSRRGGRAYTGASSRRPVVARAVELVPEAPGLHRCPVCKGHVKLVGSPYTDLELGIRQTKTKLLASHLTGGAPSRGHAGRCIGSLTLPENSSN